MVDEWDVVCAREDRRGRTHGESDQVLYFFFLLRSFPLYSRLSSWSDLGGLLERRGSQCLIHSGPIKPSSLFVFLFSFS